MLGQDQAARDISSVVSMSMQQLYSTEDNILLETDKEKIKEAINRLLKYDIDVVDEIGDVNQIISTIISYVNEQKLMESDEGLIMTFDHSLLVKGDSDREKDIIDKFYKSMVVLKKQFEAAGIKCLFIILSQLNRDIESNERVVNPMLHYPNKNDLFASSAAYYCSDYVIITHKPSVVNGIAQYYGPARGLKYPYGLPVFNPKNNEQAMVYLHVIKARFSTTKIIMMLDDFANSRILPYKPD